MKFKNSIKTFNVTKHDTNKFNFKKLRSVTKKREKNSVENSGKSRKHDFLITKKLLKL